jgi:hypothetical protein
VEATVELLEKFLRDGRSSHSENVVVPVQLIVRNSVRQPAGPAPRQRKT